MSYAIPYEDMTHPEPEALPAMRYVPRSRFLWTAFLLPVALCGMSYMADGVPIMTDLGFIILALACAICLVIEIVRFPFRFGIGGMVAFGGVLIWFCHDYLTNWVGYDFNTPGSLTADIIAKSAFYHTLFALMMVMGLQIKRGKWLERCVLAIPDPGSEGFYIALMLGMAAIGFSPFVLVNAEPPWLCCWHYATGGWTGGALFSVFRTGNVNYNWGGYFAQVLDVGSIGGLFAAAYALLVARRKGWMIFAWLIWLYWAMASFQSDRRGEFAFMCLPPLGIFFIKHQARTAALYGRHSFLAYVVGSFLLLCLLFGVQYQGQFRGTGLASGDVSAVELTKVRGNSMFSEGLAGFADIPKLHEFFWAPNPFLGLIMPMPHTVYSLVVNFIPRALWTSKPIDPLWAWYNNTVTGEHTLQGTTISHGMVGYWYFNFGIFGVIEGGLFSGWMMVTSERALQNSEGKPLGVLMSLSLATFMFRGYRDLNFSELYPVILGALALVILMIFMRPFMGKSPTPEIPT